MKLRSQREGLAVIATIAAVLPKDTLMAITANRTVNRAGANAVNIGRLVVAPKTAGAQGTVETRFKEYIEIKVGADLGPGTLVKLAAADGTTGENVVVAWVSGTDGAERLFGIVWSGALNGAVAEVLTY